MKGIILAGGFGTRLRPLTLNYPKPLIEFANLPMIEYQVQGLAEVGCTEIILAVSFKPDLLQAFQNEMEKKYGIKMSSSFEEVPLGTGGAVRYSKDKLVADNPEGLIFVCNSDVICDRPFKQMLERHKASEGSLGVMLLSKAEDPSKYGVVKVGENHKIMSFHEKPKEYISNRINAGVYLLDVKVLDTMEVNLVFFYSVRR